MFNIVFINNSGTGFADSLEVPDGFTLEDLFKQKLGSNAAPDDYLIRVKHADGSGGPAPRSQRLQANDRVSITPRKIQGAIFMVINCVLRAGRYTIQVVRNAA